MASNQSSSPMNVLVVDDHCTYREFVVDCLKDAGHTVVSASDGPLALQVLNDQQFDLALVDLKMPGMTGLGLIGVVRADARHREIKIVVLARNTPTTIEKHAQ